MRFVSLLPFCLLPFAHGQVYTPPPEAPASSPPPAAANETSTESSAPPAGPLGREIPLLDPSAETITIGGVTIPIGDNRLLKARFEKYLSQEPESGEAAEEYRRNLREILDTISPFHPGGPDLSSAFKLLPAAASYPGDANLCGSLAESVYMAMLAKQDVNGLNKLNKSIEDEKQSIIREADWTARKERDNSLVSPEKQNEDGSPARPSSAQRGAGLGVNSLRYQERLRRIAEIEVLKKANIARTEAQTLQTKAQYQVNMVQWFVQRRFEHVLMACRFYNQIWKDGDAALRIKKDSDVSKLFSESVGVSPTVSSLDSLSNEAIREAAKYIEAFELMLGRGDLHTASQRLMEAYTLGEYLAPVATLPLEKKQRVAQYVRDLHELYGTLQARDFTKAQELAGHLKTVAKDFPSSKVDSLISASTLASDLAIEEAKAHLMARDTAQATEKITAATEIWPTNPRLGEFRQLVSGAGGMVSARNDFDRLLSESNFREIARRQYELAPAIQGDATREEAFKQIMANLTTIETALGKAGEFSKVGQNYAAWEQLAALREQFPDDPKLGRELEILAPKVADFTLAIDKARQFENRTPRQTGSALSWYLKARSVYPQSSLAGAGIERVLNDILPAE